MENISPEELDVMRTLHLGGRGICVVFHAPQEKGGCVSFESLRGVLPDETYKQAYDRVKPDILRHVAEECGCSCECDNGVPFIWAYVFGARYLQVAR